MSKEIVIVGWFKDQLLYSYHSPGLGDVVIIALDFERNAFRAHNKRTEEILASGSFDPMLSIGAARHDIEERVDYKIAELQYLEDAADAAGDLMVSQFG